jgi:hypothetical protein
MSAASVRKFVHVVNTEFPLVVHRGDKRRVLPEEDVLAPAHLFAADEEAGQRSDGGDGKHQWAAPHEWIEQELHGEGKSPITVRMNCAVSRIPDSRVTQSLCHPGSIL